MNLKMIERQTNKTWVDIVKEPAYKEQIIKEIERAREGDYSYKTLKEYFPNSEKKNEAVFFVKPEITAPDSGVDISKVMDIIYDSFARFGVSIDGICVLGADYLKAHNIISRHYGVIDALAREGPKAFSEAARASFEGHFGVKVEDALILGGYQFLERYSYFTPQSLDVLWENNGIIKLAGGTYCSKHAVSVANETLYIINGFNPRQVAHYTDKGRSIVVMVISTDADWPVMRNDMIGVTIPEDAKPGSIRRTLLEKKGSLHIKEVRQSYNCVHLSAGPIESLAELTRFISYYEAGTMLDPKDTMIGKKMLDSGIPKNKIEWLLTNPKIKHNHYNEISAFDLTEEKNTEDMIKIIKEIL